LTWITGLACVTPAVLHNVLNILGYMTRSHPVTCVLASGGVLVPVEALINLLVTENTECSEGMVNVHMPDGVFVHVGTPRSDSVSPKLQADVNECVLLWMACTKFIEGFLHGEKPDAIAIGFLVSHPRTPMTWKAILCQIVRTIESESDIILTRKNQIRTVYEIVIRDIDAFWSNDHTDPSEKDL
jgi:hypothetical protein